MKAYKVPSAATSAKARPTHAPWRPTGKTLLWGLGWAYIFTACSAPILFLHIFGGTHVDSPSWLDWTVLISTGTLYISLIFLFAWLIFKPAAPQPHPFSSGIFWLSALALTAVATLLWFILGNIGLWSWLDSTLNIFPTAIRGLLIYPCTWGSAWLLGKLWKRLPSNAWYKRHQVSSGLSCGVFLSILVFMVGSIVALFLH